MSGSPVVVLPTETVAATVSDSSTHVSESVAATISDSATPVSESA